MPRVERPPASIQESLEPRAEIHWTRHWRDADVPQIARDISSWNVQRPAERDGEMLEVAADAYPFRVDVERRPRLTGLRITERHLVVNPVTNGLNPRPSARNPAEKLDSRVR